MKTARVTLRLAPDQVQKLQEIVAPLDLSVSHALRQIVKAYLADVASFRTMHRQGGARSLVAMLDGMGGALRSMDMQIRTAESSIRANEPGTQHSHGNTLLL